MKKIIPFILFAFTTTFLICCSKNDSTTDTVDQTPKIKAQTSATDTITFTYDASGRIATEIFNPYGNKAEYTYSPGEIIQKFTSNGIPSISYMYSLNADGLVTKISNTVNTDIVVYTYNPDKTKSSETSIFPTYSLRFDFFYSNGNIDSIRHSDETGRWTNTTFLTYYLDQPRKLSYHNKGIIFFGNDTRNMLKSKRYSYANTSYQQEDYEYIYDSNGKVVTQKTTYITGGTITRIYIAALTYY